MIHKILTMSMISFSISTYTHANDLFSAQLSVDGVVTPYQSYDKILDLADQYRTSHLKAIAPSYSNTSAVQSRVKYLGLDDISIGFEANSNVMVLDIPTAKIYKEFNGATRNDSRKMMVDYLKKSPETLTDALVASSFHHPVNQARQSHTYSNYESSILATDLMSSGIDQIKLQGSKSATSFAPRFGRYSQGDIDTDIVTLPISYAKWLPGQKFMLVLDAPFTISKSDEALAGQASLGIGINSAINDNWFLMPQVRVGATISPDMGTASSLFGSGLTSNYQVYLTESSRLNIINIASYYKTASLKIKDYHSKYDLDNFVFRNGLEYTQALNGNMFNRAIVLKAHASRTDYTGDALFNKYSHDVGFSIGLKDAKAHSLLQDLRIGFNYNQGDRDTDGFSINAGYTF